MTKPILETTAFGGAERAPVLILGPSLGTSVTALWSQAATTLAEHYRVIGWDLPGHGRSPSPSAPFSVRDVADAVHAAAQALGVASFHYAGVSVGGAVGLELLLRHGESLESAALICTGAKIRTHSAWIERAQTVRSAGTSVMVGPATTSWFSAGFIEREPETSGALLASLTETDTEGYAAVCEALAVFDVREQLATISADVLTVAGTQDIATPPETVRYLADRIPRARYLELADAAHLAPAEQPELIAEALLNISTQRSAL